MTRRIDTPEFIHSETGQVLNLATMEAMLAYTICPDGCAAECISECKTAEVWLDQTEVQEWVMNGPHDIYTDDVIASYRFHREATV